MCMSRTQKAVTRSTSEADYVALRDVKEYHLTDRYGVSCSPATECTAFLSPKAVKAQSNFRKT